MRPLEDWLPQILPRANHCPEPIALDAIRSAAITFCERTRLWRAEDRFKVSRHSCDEIICVPYGAALHQIESARFDGRPLEAVSLSELDASDPDWRKRTGSIATYITQERPNTLRLVPAANGELALSLFLRPSEDADELPAFLYELYARVLADGALEEILTIPGQPFTSADLAHYHGTRFERALDRLSSQSVRGQQRAPIRITPQFF